MSEPLFQLTLPALPVSCPPATITEEFGSVFSMTFL